MWKDSLLLIERTKVEVVASEARHSSKIIHAGLTQLATLQFYGDMRDGFYLQPTE